jgi:hypothetical protein
VFDNIFQSQSALSNAHAAPDPEETKESQTLWGPKSSHDPNSYLFTLHHDQTTLALGLQTHISALRDACEAMQGFIQQGFSKGDVGGDAKTRMQIERFVQSPVSNKPPILSFTAGHSDYCSANDPINQQPTSPGPKSQSTSHGTP